MIVRPVEAADCAAIAAIVNHYIAATTINFRTQPQTADDWLAIWTAQRARYPWLVAHDHGVVGVAYAGPWNPRAAYDWACEVTVYVAHDAGRRGIGRALYERLLADLAARGFRTQVAIIALPNDPSVALHEAFGFRHTGTLRGVGYKHGAWRDVGFWQRAAESDEPPAPLS